MQEEGQGQIIVTTTFERSDRFFDASGKLQPLAQYRKFEMTTYAEYGATDWLTLIFAPSSSQSAGSIGPVDSADRYLRVEAGARIRVWRNDHSIVSFQATFRAPYAIDTGVPPGLRREVNEADLRALYGHSFQVFGRAGFFNAELAWRARAGMGDEWRADFTLGYRIVPRFLLLLQNFNVSAQGSSFMPHQRWHKLQVTGVFDFTEKWSVQAGIYATLLGVNMRREQGFIGGIWTKF